jgi:hypothetical protein
MLDFMKSNVVKYNSSAHQNQCQPDLFPETFPPVFCAVCGNSHPAPTCPDIELDYIPYLPARPCVLLSNFRLQQKNLLKAGYKHQPHKFERGVVCHFSSKSARRLKFKLSQMDMLSYKTKLFCTFTFRDVYPIDYYSLHSYLLILLKRIERIVPDSCIVWRIEYQKRMAPHFHLMVFTTHPFNTWKKNNLAKRIKDSWGSLTQYINKYSYTVGSDIVEIKGIDNLFFYISKYCSKPSDVNLKNEIGRYWGIRGNMKVLSEKEFECSE